MFHCQNGRLNCIDFHRSLSWFLYYLILSLIIWMVEERDVHFSTARYVNPFVASVPETLRYEKLCFFCLLAAAK